MQITVTKFLDLILLDGYKLMKLAGAAKGTKELNSIMEKGKKFISLSSFKENIQLLWFVSHVNIIKL